MNIVALKRDELDTGSANSYRLAPTRAADKTGEITKPLVFRPTEPGARPRRWGIVLAGGDGMRLRPLVKFICGEERPKQFCPLVEGRTLLEQTLRRAELTIPREQLLVSVVAQHSKWFLREDGLSLEQLIVQPANKGTAPAVLHSVLGIAQIDKNALVAILPSDHHYSNESLFSAMLESAFLNATEYPAIVLLGAQPDHPEVEYGWIELGARLPQYELFGVRGFHEKPSLKIARKLFSSQQSAWNTFVMVGRVKAFVAMFQSALPELHTVLAGATLWKGRETHGERSLYKQIPFTDLSKEVLSAETKRLLVLRLGDVGWSDLGNPSRVVTMFASPTAPEWLARWRHANGAEAIA